MSRLKICAAAALLSVLVRSASAQDLSSGNRAEDTFLAGRALLADKHYAEACAKFRESQLLDPASGTLLALAYCEELAGLLASSHASYVATAELAQREGQVERRAAALERVQALTPRVSRLTVVVPQELLVMPGFHLVRDGVEFERASFGIALPTDGGSHAFFASAPGRISWASTVTLSTEGDQKTLILPILDLAEPKPAAPQTDAKTPPASEPAHGNSEAALRRASLALAAGAVLGIGLGTAFALSAKSKKDESNSDGHCDETGCDAQGLQLRNDALSDARVSTWTFVAGGALTACSVTLYLMSYPSSADPKTSVGSHTAISANVSVGEPRVYLSGSF